MLSAAGSKNQTMSRNESMVWAATRRISYQFLGEANGRGLFGEHFTEERNRPQIAAHFIMQIARHAKAHPGEPPLDRQAHFIGGREKQKQADHDRNSKQPGLPKMWQNDHCERRAGFIPNTVIVAPQHAKKVSPGRK